MVRSVVQHCRDVSRLADLISGAGPVKITVTGSHVALRRGSTTRADIDDPDLAAFLASAPGLLRSLAEAIATVYAEHTPTHHPPRPGDRCPHCGTPDPCRTRRLLDVRILRDPATPPDPAARRRSPKKGR